jgi:hypothetical protein
MGWKYIPLIELNLAGRDDSRPAYAIEQQLQIKTFSQKLGYQRLNRIPGIDNWDIPGIDNWDIKPTGTVMVGFAYAPRGWLEENYDDIAIVRGTQNFVPPKAGSSKDGSEEDLTDVLGIY